jgi:iron complex outermembrane receptor protein
LLREAVFTVMLACGSSACLCHEADTAPDRMPTRIRAQALGPALQTLAEQRHFQIVYVSEELVNRRTSGVAGDLTFDEALTLILRNTGCSFRHIDEQTVTVFPEPSGRAPATAATGEASLADVIVTARRREESLQQVPISITVFSGLALEQRDIDDMLSLSAVVPNVQIKQNQSGANFSNIRVRGVPAVAVYADGVAYTNIAGQLMDLVDVARIEVLEGPQGTLFGKNAIGGAIQYITNPPGDRFGGDSKLTFGAFGRVDATAVLNLPWSDTLLLKVVGASLYTGGYVRDIDTGDYEGAAHRKIARLDVLWQPQDYFSARMWFNYNGETTNQPPFVNMANNRVCAGDPIPPSYSGKIPGPLCVLSMLGLDVDPGLDFGAQGKWLSAAGTNGPAGYDFSNYNYAADLRWRFSDRAGLRSITGYRSIDWAQLSDNDGTPLVLVTNTDAGIASEFTEELQLAYADQRWNGTSGLYYYRNATTKASISWNYSDLLAGSYAQESMALGGRSPGLNESESRTAIEGFAVFSEWTARLGGGLSATAGGRYTSENNTTWVYPPPPVSLACCQLLGNLTPGGAALFPPRRATFDQFTPRLSLQYDWTPVVTTYATFSKGFNAGGFNLVGGAPLPYQPETLSNYEIGLKSDLLGRRLRLNATGFYGLYDRIQVTVVLPVGQTVVQATGNAGAGEVKGLEFQSTWLATDHLVFDLAAGWLQSRYTNVGTAEDLTVGTAFPFSPEYNYNAGAQYTWNLRGDELSLRGDYTWVDHTETNIDPLFALRLDSYGLLNARLAFQKADARWSVALSGTNLTNQFYLVHGLNITQEGWALGGAGRPREWVITCNVKF